MKKCMMFCLCLMMQIQALKLDRVILATDANPDYIEFWPIVAKAWKEIIGIKPTLALIAHKDVQIDESLGDVIRFEPLEGIPTSFQAQVIRLFLPALYPDDVCILSDIDMIPLKKSYFEDSVKDCPEDSFVIYRDRAYREDELAYPMCYLASRGSTFGEVFDVHNLGDISAKIESFHAYGLGWCTDELLLYQYLNNWQGFSTRCIKLGHGVQNRVDRSYWQIDHKFLRAGNYIDAHCPRPYSQHKGAIDKLIHPWNEHLSNIKLYSHDPHLIRIRPALGDLNITGEVNIIHSLIKAGDVVFDVGANCGEWTKAVLDYVQPQHLYAFEPVPSVVKLFKDNILNDHVSLHEFAIARRSGNASFFHYPHYEGIFDNGTLSSLYRRSRVEQLSNMSGFEIEVKTISLDDFCTENKVDHINFLKIDTEGAEFDVLYGSKKMLFDNKIDFIQFEYGHTYTDSGYTLKEVYHYLKDFGYAVFKVQRDGLAYVREWSDSFEDYYQSNYLAVSPCITENSYEFKELEAVEPAKQREAIGTHMALLLTAVARTTGPILEMGAGDYSTPLLHALCSGSKRLLFTIDTSRKVLYDFLDLNTQWHGFAYVPVYEDDWSLNPKPELWDEVGKDIYWSVVLVNHRPGHRRVQDIERLRSHTCIFVVHDTQEAGYGYAPVLDTFKYKYVDERYATQTTIVSDMVDVSKFFID